MISDLKVTAWVQTVAPAVGVTATGTATLKQVEQVYLTTHESIHYFHPLQTQTSDRKQAYYPSLHLASMHWRIDRCYKTDHIQCAAFTCTQTNLDIHIPPWSILVFQFLITASYFAQAAVMFILFSKQKMAAIFKIGEIKITVAYCGLGALKCQQYSFWYVLSSSFFTCIFLSSVKNLWIVLLSVFWGFLSLSNKGYYINSSNNNFGQQEKRTSNLLISILNRSSNNIHSFIAETQNLFLSSLQKRDALAVATMFVLLFPR